MNLHIALRNIFLILLSLCVQPVVFAALPSESNERLTEQRILNFLKVREDAYIRGDAAAWISTLADNYTSTTERPGKPVSKLTRVAVEASLAKNLPLLSGIQLNYEDTKINISQDGRSASVSRKGIEKLTLTMKNVGVFNVKTIYLGTSTFELRGGKIVATSDVFSILEEKVSREVSPVIETDNIYCMKGDECEDMWAQALAFARRQFSRELFFESDTLIRSTDPEVEKAEFQDGSRRKVSKMIIRRTHLGSGKYEIEFDFKCGTACIVSSSAEMKKDFVSSMKLYQKNRPKTDTSSPPVSTQAAPPASGAVSVEDQLKKLQDLFDKKIITDQEYKAMRAKALGL